MTFQLYTVAISFCMAVYVALIVKSLCVYIQNFLTNQVTKEF